MTPAWKQFEIAIANFLKALDKNAKITHDAKIPDRDTGQLRQRDVWVEAMICQMFPIKIYVSCKFTNTKINEQDMDAVIGELRSSGANKGVIYSKIGFTDEAIIKAAKVDISCCKLYDNQPPDLPEFLLLKQYLVRSAICFKIVKMDTENPPKTYDDLFKVEIKNINGDKNKILFLDRVVILLQKLEKHAMKEENKECLLPKDWVITSELETHNNKGKIKIKLGIHWKIFEAKLRAWLTNGSYSFTEKIFIGEQTSPVIDIQSAYPGNGWQLLEKRPEISGSFMVIFFNNGDYKNALLENFKLKTI